MPARPHGHVDYTGCPDVNGSGVELLLRCHLGAQNRKTLRITVVEDLYNLRLFITETKIALVDNQGNNIVDSPKPIQHKSFASC